MTPSAAPMPPSRDERKGFLPLLLEGGAGNADGVHFECIDPPIGPLDMNEVFYEVRDRVARSR